MRYTFAELLEDKKLRTSVAKLAEKKELDFEDGNGVFDLDFRGQTLRINNRSTYDKLFELGGEKLLKKLLKAENTCLSTDRNAANQGACAVRGAENYFLLLNAGATKAFSSILNGIAAWAKMDKHFDLELVCVSTAGDEEEEESSDLMSDWEAPKGLRWFHNGEDCSGLFMNMARNSVLSETDGKPVFVDADTGREIHLYTFGWEGNMVTCEPLRAEEDAPIVGYRYQAEEGGKWGFISTSLACVMAPQYDEMVVTEQYVAAWTKQDEDKVTLTLSVFVEQEETGLQEHWLTYWAPTFENVPEYYTPLHDAVLEEQELEDGRKARLYIPGQRVPFGLFSCSSAARLEMRGVRYEKGFITGEKAEWKVPARGLSLEKCLQLEKEPDAEVQIAECVVEPEWSEIGTYIIRRDGYYALANVDISGEPEVKHLSTPLAYTKMSHPQNWRNDWVMVERFGKKGIYNWLKEEFVVPCEYEKISVVGEEYVLVRHGKERKLNSYGRWVEETKLACPKCKAELVQGALYCHMCGMSLTEPEKKAESKQEGKEAPQSALTQEAPKAEMKSEPEIEVKPEPIKEEPKPVEPPKPVFKPSAEVPTAENFKETYREWGRRSHVRKEYNNPNRGTLDVCTWRNGIDMDDTDPMHFLYGNLEIRRKQSDYAVNWLQGMKAYALVKDGLVYEKDGVIWFLHVSGEKQKLGEQKGVLFIDAASDNSVQVSYVKRFWQTAYDQHRDEVGYTYEATYNVYDVDIGTVTLLLPASADAEVPARVPTSKNFYQEFSVLGRGSQVSYGRLIIIVKSDGDPIPGDHSPEQYIYEKLSIEDKKAKEVVDGLKNLSAYALSDDGIFFAKNDEIWYWTTDGKRRKLGAQKNVIKITNQGGGKLMVEYVESYHQTNWCEDMDSEQFVFPVCFDGYDVNTKKIVLNY